MRDCASVERKSYKIEYDRMTGEITGLYDRLNPLANWKAEEPDKKMGVVFLHGTQWAEDEIPFTKVEGTENGLLCASATGVSQVLYDFEPEAISMSIKTGKDCGPRVGVQMNLNLLDMPTAQCWRSQCMPKVIYTDDSYQYAYFIFATADGRFLGMAVDGEFAAWRILYNYGGHKMQGFQILTQADDVVCDGDEKLPSVDKLSVTLMFAESYIECMRKIAVRLGIEIALPDVSGGPKGGSVSFEFLNRRDAVMPPTITTPTGASEALDGENSMQIPEAGMYLIKTTGRNKREHCTRVLSHDSWKEMYDKVSGFNRDHFQDECGACYRVITKDTLKPDGVTFEGVQFGDPTSHFSCRTGEFGGFAAWVMMKNCLLFGKNDKLMESVQKYILNWTLNRGHEDKPYIGTVYKKSAEYKGRKYSPYHLYQELNYLQYEIFLLEELADYVRLTDDKEVLEDAVNLTEHILLDHFEDGELINENTPGHRVDYTTVHAAICGFITLGRILRDKGDERAGRFYKAAEQIADHVCRRGMNFPTEGEPCTEDGSMGCTVLTLMLAYREVAPKQEYLEVGEEILRTHNVLEMNGTDCRMKNSSIRFWETQYESRDWGPSINAGHGWSIWTAEAKALYARIKADFDMLRDSYEGFITNMCKIEESGGMSCSFTPDMIPGTPHAYYTNRIEVPDSCNELRPTSTYLANKYVAKTYSTSGNYFLIRAADTFAYMSGYDCEKGTVINGTCKDHVFESAAPEFSYLLIKGRQEVLHIRVKKGQEFTIAVEDSDVGVTFEHAWIKEQNDHETVLVSETDCISVRCH